MISTRIKKLLERIHKATEGDDYGLYIVTLRNGVYTCNDPVMTCTSEAEFENGLTPSKNDVRSLQMILRMMMMQW